MPDISRWFSELAALSVARIIAATSQVEQVGAFNESTVSTRGRNAVSSNKNSPN